MPFYIAKRSHYSDVNLKSNSVIRCILEEPSISCDAGYSCYITETSPYKSYPRFAPNICKNGENLGLVLNDKKWKFLLKIICCGDLLESPRGGDSNR